MDGLANFEGLIPKSMQKGLKAVIGAADLDACSGKVNALTYLRFLMEGFSRMSVPAKWFTPAVKDHLDGIDELLKGAVRPGTKGQAP